MKNILGELWYGNISPQEDSRNNTPDMKQLMDYMARHHDDLLKTLSEEQRDIFERFDDCWSEYASLAEEAIFVYAFRLGAQMTLDPCTAAVNKCTISAFSSSLYQRVCYYT